MRNEDFSIRSIWLFGGGVCAWLNIWFQGWGHFIFAYAVVSACLVSVVVDAFRADARRKAIRESRIAMPGPGSVPIGTTTSALAFRPMSDTAWLDGRDVVLLARDMLVEARYSPGSWSEDTPVSPAEYDGAVWVCFDDEFRFEIEEISDDPAKWHHGAVKLWSDKPLLEASNARAE